ncbi:MAG: hypothetical protein KDA84_12050 [Planctomycetaceae bacterium]|nr:hypothetical protein [Planctomycetaceae bacterium]
MTRNHAIHGLTALVLIVGSTLAFRASISADNPQNSEEKQFAKPTVLGGENRYLTHVSTDKPIYRAGEKVYVRGVILEAHRHTPLEEKTNLAAQVTIKGPKGDVVAQAMTNAQHSTLGFAWPVPEGQAGGEYIAEISFPWTGQPAAKRKFEIRAYRAPRLKSQIEFVRDGYGPGDRVSASLKVERAEGGIPVGAKVVVRARVDGEQVYEAPAIVDTLGLCSARFELPKDIKRGEGTLAFAIEDGGIVETAAKTIPILLQTVDLTMYPEGGELVADLPNRVYLAALTPAKKPADLAGEIVDGNGKPITQFRTEHEGRGRFQFTPKAGERYTLKITEPSGIKTTFPLPEVQAEGAVISSPKNIIDSGESVSLRVGSSKTGKLKLTLSQLEKELDSITLDAIPNQTATVKLDPKEAEGVLIATLWDADGVPLAERLVFRKPAGVLQVSITPDRKQYVPGGQAKLNIKTTDAKGKPVSAVVGLTVTDDSVLEMIEKREQAPQLPVMVLLENDVNDLADAHIYLDDDNPEAPLAVDLLLGTQGWRRFAFLNTTDFLTKHGDKARNVLALTMSTRFEEERRNLLMRQRRLFQDFDAPNAEVENKAVRLAAPQKAAAPLPKLGKGQPGNGQPDDPNAGQGPPIPNAPVPAREPDASQPQQNAKADEKPRGKLRDALDRSLRKQAAKEAILAKDELLVPRGGRQLINMVVVREYAHKLQPNRQPGQRWDFTETLYWNAGIKTDPKTGEASVSFALNDSVTSFKVLADAFDQSGSLAEATTKVESVEPFYTEPKLPLEVTSGDVIQLPVGLVNSTQNPLSNANVTVSANDLVLAELGGFDLSANERLRKLVLLKIGQQVGTTDVVLNAKAGPFADQVTRQLDVKPLGFPVEIAHGGTLDPDNLQEHKIVIPQTVVPGSLMAQAHVYPTPMASLTGALERLIREPYGCFEQTSSSTYPLVMAQQYFQSHTGIDPDLIKRSNAMLEKGYKRLTGYE